MTVAKIVELSSESNKGFEHALNQGIERARRTLDGVRGVWVQDQQVRIESDGKPIYRVTMKVTFVMND